MTTTRQDAWTQDEDLLLAEVVLRHIREGGTQLQAFEEVGKKLTRTAAACGFRWNSAIRKQYKSGIELAKKQRKEAKKSPNGEVNYKMDKEELSSTISDEQPNTSPEFDELGSFDSIIVYLNKLYDQAQHSNDYQETLLQYEEKVTKQEKKIREMEVLNEKLKKELYAMEHDYKALIEIMERARKMVVLKDEEFAQKVRFQMDKNGNLEKLDK